MHLRALLGIVCLAGSIAFAAEPQATSSGNATIRAPFAGSEITITTTDRLAGAIHSLTWGGKEFIDSHDHGRQLQSACSFDCARPGEFWAERYNPTEAGSRDDGAGERSSSRLLSLNAEGAELRTTTRMAFWLAPGEKSVGRPALNDKVLSGHLLAKRVHIGHKDLPNVIEYDVTFTVPKDEVHHFAQFEALTGYMPIEFNQFWTFRPASGRLEPRTGDDGEQAYPAVVSNDAGTHAMGVWSPDQPSPGFEHAGYGHFRFPAERVVKWNCVFRVRAPNGLAAGDYRYRMFVAVGTLEDVRRAMAALVAEHAGR